jgi:hypothetical protein
MMKAHLINKYVYTIDSVKRLHDAAVYQAKMEKRYIADSIKTATDSTNYVRWIEANLKLARKQKSK